MSLRYLYGPVSDNFSRECLPQACERGDCLPFGRGELWHSKSWEEFVRRWPPGFQPDFMALHLRYEALPTWLLQAPVPLVGLAGDAPWLWHGYRQLLPALDLVLADVSTVERFQQLGINHAKPAILFGLESSFLLPANDQSRDIDILFVGNFHYPLQKERLPWTARLARFAERWKVILATGVWHEDYRALLSRTRIVFNRSVRGEWNHRSGEGIGAGGALLIQESSNREVPDHLTPGRDYVVYDDEADLDHVLQHYLEHEDERRSIAESGRAKADKCTFEEFWNQALRGIETDFADLQKRAQQRRLPAEIPDLLARVWRATSSGGDPSLYGDLLAARASQPQSAELQNALGLANALQAQGDRSTGAGASQSLAHFRQAIECDAGHLLARLNLAEALIGAGQQDPAVTVLRHLLDLLDRNAGDDNSLSNAPRFPFSFDLFRADWEAAAWDARNVRDEVQAKRTLLRWRTHYLLGQLTGDLAHFHEAVQARPDLPWSRAALGCALGRAGKPAMAATHLRHASAANPFDSEAARALFQALTDAGKSEEAQELAHERRLLHRAAPALVHFEPWFNCESQSRLRLQRLTPATFVERFGRPDLSRALCAFTPPQDAHVVLTLLAKLQPRRILEIGTAAGHMTANLTEWSPDDALVYSMGTTADMQGTCKPEQQGEAPPVEHLGRFAGHFRKRDKVCFITADSLRYDFRRLAPLDFAFIDGAHDREHVLSDTRNVYAALQPGGCIAWHDFGSPTPWVEVRQAIEEANLPEPVYHVEGTQVAFLFKEGQSTSRQQSTAQEQNGHAPALATRASQLTTIRWEGAFAGLHSLALVNRGFCEKLADKGWDLQLQPRELNDPGIAWQPLSLALSRCRQANANDAASVHVQHYWPPEWQRPNAGKWVVILPWEYGSVPRAWFGPLRDGVDEIWVPSRYVRDCFAASGIPAAKIQVIPNGIDPDLFKPDVATFLLPTRKRFKFLFVGGTIWRKGIDLLLHAYADTFTAHDDVCLVLKDFGQGAFYKDQTAEPLIAELRQRADAPEIVYLNNSLSSQQVAGLYAACDCLVHPYRGEGFGLPIAEAMACGLPAIVTNHGAALDFCSDETSYLIPARVVQFRERKIGDFETVDRPWVAEPDLGALSALMRHASAHPQEAQAKGQAASAFIREHFTWEHAVRKVEERLQALTGPRASAVKPAATTPSLVRRATVWATIIAKNEEKNIGKCLASIIDLVDGAVVVDTGSTDRTKEIAASFGPKVKIVDFPWVDSFAAARNEAIRHAPGDYCFWMDCDDFVDEPNRELLRKLFASLTGENIAVSMKCLCPADPNNTVPTLVDHVRLFRNLPTVRWRYRVHEQILGSVRNSGGEVRFADIVIIHVGYLDPALRSRKRQRDLRLLNIAIQEEPDEPFICFNLGMTLQDMGKHEEALVYLQRSLGSSDPSDSIVRKLYSMIASSQTALGRKNDALDTYAAGLKVIPDDAELLFRQAVLLKESGDLAGAEASLLTLLSSHATAPHFASTDPTLRGWRGRNELANVYMLRCMYREAQAQWRQVIQEFRGCFPAWLGLADVALTLNDENELENVARQLERFEGGQIQGDLLRCRLLLNKQRRSEARALAAKMLQMQPDAPGPLVILARIETAEGHTHEAEEAWHKVLVRNPAHEEGLRVLADLIRQRSKNETAFFEALSGLTAWLLDQHYQAACTTPSPLQLHLPVLCDLARECKHVTDVGTGEGKAALAFLWAQPNTLVCVDVVQHSFVESLKSMAGTTQLTFHRADSMEIDLDETDLLFLDTRHDGPLLQEELRRHANKVRKYLVLHGTAKYADQGETQTQPGIKRVIDEFLTGNTFRVQQVFEEGEGLNVLARVY